jgi:hypothetical protein
MYDSDDDGDEGPGERTWSGVTLGGNVFNPYVGEAAMGTPRLFDDTIRLDIEDRYGWPSIWFTVASPYWLACDCHVSHCSHQSKATVYACLTHRLTGERISFEMGRIVSLESVCNLICGRLDITGPSWRRPASLSLETSGVWPGGNVCGAEEWDTFSVIGDCICIKGDALSTLA